jgi:hypothetical protein
LPNVSLKALAFTFPTGAWLLQGAGLADGAGWFVPAVRTAERSVEHTPELHLLANPQPNDR